MNIFLFISSILIFTLILGKIIEKIRIPRVFAALFLGLILSIYNPFTEITSSSSFKFMSDMGMYFLLFIIGLELDIKEIFKQGKFIPKLSLLLFLSESIIGTIFIYYVFKIPIGIAILVSTSFATVGEAILIPILDEFKIIKTKFGQTILGVGTIDDIAEMTTIIIASIILGESIGGGISLLTVFLIILGLFIVPLSLQIFKSKIHKFRFKQVPSLFLFGMITVFIFIGIGSFVEAGSLGAILAGVALKNIISHKKLENFESIIKTISYGILVPIFFFYVGSEINIKYLLSAPLLIIVTFLITSSTKIIVSYLLAKSKLGSKKSILIGLGLSAKFSTSIVILTMLVNNRIINTELYSVLIGAMIVSQFIIPIGFSLLIKKRGLNFNKSSRPIE